MTKRYLRLTITDIHGVCVSWWDRHTPNVRSIVRYGKKWFVALSLYPGCVMTLRVIDKRSNKQIYRARWRVPEEYKG